MEHKLKPILDSLALVVSVAALIVSAALGWQAMKLSKQTLDSARIHNELSLRPMLDFQYQFNIDEDRGGFLKLVNVGEGPAEITAVSMTLDGRPVDQARLSKILDRTGIHPFELRVRQGVVKYGQIALFNIAPAKIPSGEVCPRDRRRKDFFSRLKIVVQYESLYHHPDTAYFTYASTNTSDCATSVNLNDKPIGR